MWRIRQPLQVDLVTLAVPLVEQFSAIFDVVEVPLCHAAARVLDCPGQPVELSLQVPKVHGPMVFPPRHERPDKKTHNPEEQASERKVPAWER